MDIPGIIVFILGGVLILLLAVRTGQLFFRKDSEETKVAEK
jgi:hypothetical protein